MSRGEILVSKFSTSLTSSKRQWQFRLPESRNLTGLANLVYSKSAASRQGKFLDYMLVCFYDDFM